MKERKLKSLSSLAPPFGGASGSRRLAARAQASPFDIKAALAGRTLTPICRLQAEGEVMNETPYKICLRLNAEEAEKLIANAKACGQTRTAYLRRLLNGHDLRPRPTAEFEALRTEIHQIGNNINQIARKANAGFASHDEVHARCGCWIVFMNSCMSFQNRNGNRKNSVPQWWTCTGYSIYSA